MNTADAGRLGRSRSRRVAFRAGLAEYRNAGVAVEQAPASTPAPSAAARSSSVEQSPSALPLRFSLLAFTAVTVVGALWAASGSSQSAERELAALLRGMAVIKGLLVVAAGGLVWWRLGQPASARVAVTYIASVGVLAASTVLIWQLAYIAAAAVLFHVAGLVWLVLALREGSQILRFERQAPNPSIEATSQSLLRSLWAAPHVER